MASLATATRPAVEALSVSLLQDLERRLAEGRRTVILDLGAASGDTLAFLQPFACRLVVADAGASLAALVDADPQQAAERLPALIPDNGDEPIDWVLCWDLLNYLSRPLLAVMSRRLAQVTRPGAFAHALMDPNAPLLPAWPARYGIETAGRLSRRGQEGALNRAAARHTPWDLERYGGNLAVERSVMLRSGLQEYLLRIDAQPGGPREVKAVYRT
jgi:hypothetical protein